MNTKSHLLKTGALALGLLAVINHVDAAAHVLGVEEAKVSIGTAFEFITKDVFRIASAVGLLVGFGMAVRSSSIMPFLTVGGTTVAATSLLKVVTGG